MGLFKKFYEGTISAKIYESLVEFEEDAGLAFKLPQNSYDQRIIRFQAHIDAYNELKRQLLKSIDKIDSSIELNEKEIKSLQLNKKRNQER